MDVGGKVPSVKSVRKSTKTGIVVDVRIEKLVHGGQALGSTADGKRAFVWNALPGELVRVELRKNKKRYLEGVALEILESSQDRVAPQDEAYLSTSPWQIMTFDAENAHKQQIITETMQREHVQSLPKMITMHAGQNEWRYRNKMEYSFWGDDDGLHLALFHRGSHGKRIIRGSSIAMEQVDDTANNILSVLSKHAIRASQLKTVMVRASQDGSTVAVLFVRDPDFPQLKELAEVCQGVSVMYSNPKSPASVATKLLYGYGDTILHDVILRANIAYDALSFFQVNLEVFNQAIRQLRSVIPADIPCVDMYAGVGTIGLSISSSGVLVETDAHNCELARQNAAGSNASVIHASAEKALDAIVSGRGLIVDPPRAGLHDDVIQRIRSAKPPLVAYLSCNPITQARDIAKLQDVFRLESLDAYNFFPRTPHIESLAILRRV